MKRFVAILAVSGALATTGAALAPVAFAEPNNPNANCVGDAASGLGGQLIAFGAHLGPGFIGQVASTDCFTR